MGDFWKDVKHALHLFFKSPCFTIAAVSALALGIGANTAIFTVVNTVLLKPLAYPDADRIVQLVNVLSPGKLFRRFPIPSSWSGASRPASSRTWPHTIIAGPGFNITGDRPDLVHGLHVSEAYFRVFGAPVMLGRTFTPQEDLPHGGNVVVLSYGLWQRKFGGNPAVIGNALPLGGEPYTIVGVTGRDFVAESQRRSVGALPVRSQHHQPGPLLPGRGHAETRRHAGPGQCADEARLAAISCANSPRQIRRATSAFSPCAIPSSVTPAARCFVLLGAVGLVLLIACANVANLLLVRATGRKREFAIRSALGAKRSRIIRQLLTESVMLAVAGGILGLILGFVGVRALLAISPAGLPRIGEDGSAIGLDWRVLGFTLIVSLATGVLFGLFPAFSVSRTDLNSSLKDSSNRAGTGIRHGHVRAALVVSEVLLAVVLLIGSALLIRTFVALHAVNPGFDSHNVVTMEMSLTGSRFDKTAGVAELSHDGRERLNATPGVEESAFTCCLPIQGQFGLGFTIVDRPVDPSKGPPDAGWMSASPDYYKLFRIPVLRGREFTDQDTAGAPLVALVNEALAKQFFPGKNPVGQQIIIGHGIGPDFEEPARQIVGVVGNTHEGGLGHDPGSLMIVPDAQVTDGMTKLNAGIVPLRWVVRTHNDPRLLMNQITEQLRVASGGFPVARVRLMDEVISLSTSRESFNMLLLTIFGVVALVLAAIGIYGLMAYSVEQRTQEMGIRMALGADRRTIRKLVVWQGMRLALVGLVLGIGAAFWLTTFLRSFLFGVKRWDPEVFVSVPLILAAVALLAVWLPATRASKLNPMTALRVE